MPRLSSRRPARCLRSPHGSIHNGLAGSCSRGLRSVLKIRSKNSMAAVLKCSRAMCPQEAGETECHDVPRREADLGVGLHSIVMPVPQS